MPPQEARATIDFRLRGGWEGATEIVYTLSLRLRLPYVDLSTSPALKNWLIPFRQVDLRFTVATRKP